jgi:hypothetical protein
MGAFSFWPPATLRGRARLFSLLAALYNQAHPMQEAASEDCK